jgi:hypothetical protein
MAGMVRPRIRRKRTVVGSWDSSSSLGAHHALPYVGHPYVEHQEGQGNGEDAVAEVDDAVPVPSSFPFSRSEH